MAKHDLKGGGGGGGGGGGAIKISYILGLQREGTIERERREGEKKKKRKRKRKRRKREAKIKKGMETNLEYGFSDLFMEIMDSSMILVHELLGNKLLGFHLDINLDPFSRVLLEKHPNSRFKGSWLKIPS